MRLVQNIAYRYAMSTKIDIQELESYGYEGLILAVEKFNIEKGYSFSTYATIYIKRNILYGIEIIKFGKRNDLYYDLIKAKTVIENEKGIKLSEDPKLIDDVIDLLIATGKITEDDDSKKITKMKINSLLIGNVDLNNQEEIEELNSEGYLINEDDFTEEIINKISKELLEEIIDTLSPKEAKIIKLRFGFYDNIPRTLEEIGKEFNNITGERVRQIERKALNKIFWKIERDKNLVELYGVKERVKKKR